MIKIKITNILQILLMYSQMTEVAKMENGR